jgi:hypothetical protein
MQYSTQEVADRLGISVVAVRLRLFRAHRRLREKLQDDRRSKARRMSCEANRGRQASELAQEKQCQDFAPLGGAAEFACGD